MLKIIYTFKKFLSIILLMAVVLWTINFQTLWRYIVSDSELYNSSIEEEIRREEKIRNEEEKIEELKPDLIILDINLPQKNWIDICKELRVFSQTPIIMLTARTWELDRVTGLEIWADDYIAKPFSPRELLARISSIFRRINKEELDILSFKNINIDTQKMLVEVDNKEISLTKNEYDILKKIVSENWKLVTRETIMTQIIGYEKYIYDRTIDTHIKNLRKKIWNKDMIITVRGEGYRLNH